MKRQHSAIKWLLAGGFLALLGYLLYQMPWFHWNNSHLAHEKLRSMNGHPHFIRGGFRGEPAGFHHSVHWAPILIKLGLLLFGSLLWAKGRGLARWAGGILSIIVMLTLFNPLVCAAIVGVIYLLHRRLNKHGQTGQHPEAMPAPAPQTPYDSAHLLDEWEKNTIREDH